MFLHLGEEAFQLVRLAHLQHVGDQGGRTPEPDPFSLGTGRKTQRRRQVVLPVPELPIMSTFSRASRYSPLTSCRTKVSLIDAWAPKSKFSKS